MKFPLFFQKQRYSSLQVNANLANGDHSFKSLGPAFYVDVRVKHVKGARLVLFNQDFANQLGLPLPHSAAAVERYVLDRFAWFNAAEKPVAEDSGEESRTFFATRYQDSDDNYHGSALGDGRALWMGEIAGVNAANKIRQLDIVVKGAGVTPLAWFNHPKASHRDGQLGLTEAIHEYIYSLAAIGNGIDAVKPLAVIELPFLREGTQEKAALLVRVGNHLRFAHYRNYANQPPQLKKIFAYGLKRDFGLPPDYQMTRGDVFNYLDHILSNLAHEAALYYDLHAVHGSPTFGNRTSSGGTIDLSTFVYLDAHHGRYRYMPGGSYCLGGKWGQHEQLFCLFSGLVKSFRNGQFRYVDGLPSDQALWARFYEVMVGFLTHRWLQRLGLFEREIALLSSATKQRFYQIVNAIYEASGTSKIKLKQGRIFMAAFEPRRILSQTALHFGRFHEVDYMWEHLFRVKRSWGTLTEAQARPFIMEYTKAVGNIITELATTFRFNGNWKDRKHHLKLSERREPGADLFYGSERFSQSETVLAAIHHGSADWKDISRLATAVGETLVDQALALQVYHEQLAKSEGQRLSETGSIILGS